MTPFNRLPHARALLRGLVGLAVCAVLLATTSPASAGEDDFEFGKKLAEAREFDYARMVYDRILGDKSRSDEEKDEARYGLALLRKEEAIAASGRRDSRYEDIVRLFESAAGDIEEFVKKNPKNKRSGQARLDVGTIRLAFVQWARELLDDPDEVMERKDKGFDIGKLSDDARSMIDTAIDYFKGLRPGENVSRPKPYQELASYYFVISQYFRALVEPPCSPTQMTALEQAGNDLEEYIMYHDGELLAVYAQDIYGLVWWEMAKCEDDIEKKIVYYNKAFEWFETCIYTDDQGPDHLRVITSGYYHIAQAGQDAGRTPERNFARDALRHLESMLDSHPTAWRTDNGLRAMIEWANLECTRGNTAKAIQVATDAGDRAKDAGKDYLERLANRRLNHFVSGGCGGTVSGLVDPKVLKKVAGDLYASGKHQEAIRAYQSVISSTPDTTQAFLDYRWEAWTRIAAAYKLLDDRLGEALALEPIHDAWKLGRIPHDKSKADDQNMDRAGFERRRAQDAYGALAEATGKSIFRDRQKEIGEQFVKDYPLHRSNEIGEWKAAITLWKQARDEKDNGNRNWRDTLKKSTIHFERVSKNPKAQMQDQAFVYLVRVPIKLEDYAAAATRAKQAWEFWNSAAAKAQEEEFATIRNRRSLAKAALVVWHGQALKELGKHDEVIALLTPYHTDYPDRTDATEIYANMAYDYLIQAYIAKQDIEEADRYYRALLAAAPKYGNLMRITFLLAGHYNVQREAIEKQLREITLNLNDKRQLLRTAEKEAFRISGIYTDLRNREAKAKEAIRVNDELLAEGREGVPDDILIKAKDTIEELKVKLPEMKASLDKIVPERDGLRTETESLLAQKTQLEQEIYEPLTKASGYYYEWDRALKKNEQRRDPDNVAAFARMFWRAGRLRPEVHDNWVKARELYEEYLQFPAIKKLSKAHPWKRAAIGRLGDVYVNLAEREENAVERRELVNRAVELLQNSIAEKAADNDLVVGMLADKVLVLNWRGPSGKRWRFAIPRPASVKALRDEVKKLGKDGGYPLPTFDTEQEKKDYERALGLFRRDLNTQNDDALQDLVSQSGRSTFDPILYKQLANYTPAFRLALAWIYSETGREEDVPKAVNLALSLTGGPIAVEGGTEDWWRARWIQLQVYMKTAARKLTEGTGSADAAQWLERAAKVFTGVNASYPNLGNDVIPGNRDRWRNLLEELNNLRSKAGLLPVDASITEPVKKPAPGTTDENETEGDG